MMEEYIIYAVGLAVILLIGLFIALVSKKLNISSILILLVAGIVLGKLEYKNESLFALSPAFLTVLAVAALVMIVFDAASRFRWKTIDVHTLKTFKLAFVFLILCMIGLTIAVSLIFGIKNILLALMFSSLMAGTSPDIVLSLLKNEKHKAVEMLRIESILSTPLTIIIPLILVELASKTNISSIMASQNAFIILLSQIKPIVFELVVGISAGIFAGLIIASIIKRLSEKFSPLILVIGALLTYLLAEALSGNGILSVIVMGLLFGNYYIKQKEHRYTFSSFLENSLLILVFLLIGFAIDLPLEDISMWIKASILFIIYLVIRFIAVIISLDDEELTLKDKIFMTLNVPKGIGVAIVVFALAAKISIYQIQGLDLILDIIIIFMLFSIVLATIVSKASSWFLDD